MSIVDTKNAQKHWEFSLECKVHGTFEHQLKSFTILKHLQKETHNECSQGQHHDLKTLLGGKTLGIHDLKTVEPDHISREPNTNNVFSGEGRDFFPSAKKQS